MNYQDCGVHSVLVLKAERAKAYDMDERRIIVTAIQPRKGYRVPWIVSGTAYFKPSDFSHRLCIVSELPPLPDTELTPCLFNPLSN